MKNILYVSFKYLLGLVLVLSGIVHFIKTEFYVQIMPSFLPFSEALVYISGLVEIVLGLLLCYCKTTQKAAFGIIILFIAIFPANINMYFNHERFANSELELLLRLPVQFILIYWAYLYTKKRKKL